MEKSEMMKDISVINEEISKKLFDFPEKFQDPSGFFYSSEEYQIKYALSNKLTKPLLFISADTQKTPSILMKKCNKNPYHAQIFKEILDNSLHSRVLLEFFENSTNFAHFLQENGAKPLNFAQTLNIMYQLCDFFLDFPENSEETPDIFPCHFFLQGNVLRTDLFLGLSPDFSAKVRFSKDFLLKFQPFSRESKSFPTEILVFFFIGVVFHRLFTGDFPIIQSQAPYFQRKSLENYTDDAEIKQMMKKMLNVMDMNKSITKTKGFSENLKEFRRTFHRFFQEKYAVSATFNKESKKNNEILRKLTIKIQEFLINFQTKCENREIFVEISLILGFFAVFLRNLLTFPVIYQETGMNVEMILWILALQEENRVYFKRFREYLEKTQEIHEKSLFLRELSLEIPDFSEPDATKALQFLTKHREFLESHVENALSSEIFAFFAKNP